MHQNNMEYQLHISECTGGAIWTKEVTMRVPKRVGLMNVSLCLKIHEKNLFAQEFWIFLAYFQMDVQEEENASQLPLFLSMQAQQHHKEGGYTREKLADSQIASATPLVWNKWTQSLKLKTWI